MEKSQDRNPLRNFLQRFALLAAAFSAAHYRPDSKQGMPVVRSYRDSGRQKFGFAIKPWMRKGRK